MQESEKSYDEAVMIWLRSKNGDTVLVTSLAKKFMVGQAAMLTLLNELALAGKVRRTSAKRAIGFYIPSERMIAAERRAADESIDRPSLKIDRRRSEIYAQIAADRVSLRSIG